MSLLGSAFIHLIWLAFSDASLLIASAISVAYAAVMMRWG
jgi:predicted small integral membrane protein